MQRNPNLTKSPRRSAFLAPDVRNHICKVVAAAGRDLASAPDIGSQFFLSPAEVAKLLGVSVATIYRMVEDGTLPKPIPIDRGLPLKGAKAALQAASESM